LEDSGSYSDVFRNLWVKFGNFGSLEVIFRNLWQGLSHLKITQLAGYANGLLNPVDGTLFPFSTALFLDVIRFGRS